MALHVTSEDSHINGWEEAIWVRCRDEKGFQVFLVVKNPPANAGDVRDAETWWVQSLGWEGPLQDSTAILSNIPASRISWTEEPGRP